LISALNRILSVIGALDIGGGELHVQLLELGVEFQTANELLENHFLDRGLFRVLTRRREHLVLRA
jgi:hypothetical protein